MLGIDFPEVDGNEVDDSALPDLDEDEGEEATAGSPEEEPLALPSDFSASERRDMGLEALAVFEHRIRLGHAYDLIEAVKQSINHQGAFLVDKRKHARGQKANTRSQRQVSGAAARTRSLANLYNYNRDRLLALSDGEPTDILKRININDDLKSKNWRAPRQQGDSREERAWIWTVVPPWTSPAEVDAWQLEGKPVLAFRAHSYPFASGPRAMVPSAGGHDASEGRDQQAPRGIQEDAPGLREHGSGMGYVYSSSGAQ